MRRLSINMRRLFRNKRGLGTPVSNLIILMAAVILSTIVVLFATNVITSQVQKEKLYITTSHVWYINSTTSIAALGICDTGSTDVVITQLNVKGLQCNWNGTDNYIVYCKINGTMSGDLPFVTNLSNNATTTVDIGNQPYNFTVASEGLTIKSGQSIAFYAVLPNCIGVYDLSTPVTIVISTTQGVYFAQTLVQTT